MGRRLQLGPGFRTVDCVYGCFLVIEAHGGTWFVGCLLSTDSIQTAQVSDRSKRNDFDCLYSIYTMLCSRVHSGGCSTTLHPAAPLPPVRLAHWPLITSGCPPRPAGRSHRVLIEHTGASRWKSVPSGANLVDRTALTLSVFHFSRSESKADQGSCVSTGVGPRLDGIQVLVKVSQVGRRGEVGLIENGLP